MKKLSYLSKQRISIPLITNGLASKQFIFRESRESHPLFKVDVHGMKCFHYVCFCKIDFIP